MIKKIFNYRYWVLAVLVLAAFVGIFGEPEKDDQLMVWFVTLILTKICGVGSLALSLFLANYWKFMNKI